MLVLDLEYNGIPTSAEWYFYPYSSKDTIPEVEISTVIDLEVDVSQNCTLRASKNDKTEDDLHDLKKLSL